MIDRPIPRVQDSPSEARAFIEESRRRLLEIADRCPDLGLSPASPTNAARSPQWARASRRNSISDAPA